MNELYILIIYDHEYEFDDNKKYHMYQIDDNSVFVTLRDELPFTDLDHIVSKIITNERLKKLFPNKILNIKFGDMCRITQSDPTRDTFNRIIEIEDKFDSIDNKVDYDLPRII